LTDFVGVVDPYRRSHGTGEAMYAVIRHYKTDVTAFDAMMARVESDMADIIPRDAGALMYTAVRTGVDTALTITYFADRAAAELAAAAAVQVRVALDAEFGVEQTDIQEGPVLIHRAEGGVAQAVHFERLR
jgi:hypothetical protein